MPPAFSLRLVVFCMFFKSLCWNLVRGCPGAVSMSRVLQTTVILGANVGSFGAHVASILESWGMIERSMFTWEHKKGDLGVQVWISNAFNDFGTSFWKFLATFAATFVLWHMCFLLILVPTSRFFADFGCLNVHVWIVGNKHLVCDGVHQTTFHTFRGSVDFSIIFSCFDMV